MTLPRRIFALIAVLAVVLAACGSGDDGPSELVVEDARIDLPANPEVAAVYLVIRNDTDTDDVLIGAESVVGRASIHRTEIDDEGFSTMVHIDELDMAAGETVTFEPLGLHVMLEGIEDPLEIGGGVPITFTFAEAGDVEFVAEVVEPGGSRAADDPHAGHDHDHDHDDDHGGNGGEPGEDGHEDGGDHDHG